MAEINNKKIVLIMGPPSSGKTTSLMNMENQDRIAYLNVDLKELPFKSKLRNVNIVDPKKIIKAIQQIESSDKIDSGVVDTITLLMNQFERQYVKTHTNEKGKLDTMGGWGEYSSFYGEVLQAIKGGTKNYAVFAHEADVEDKKTLVLESKVPIKGAVGKIGAEADFTTILATKKIPLDELEEWGNKLLTITDFDKANGFKYVFQTRIDRNSIGEKMRSAIDLWDFKEKYINNDLSLVFKRLNDYYND